MDVLVCKGVWLEAMWEPWLNSWCLGLGCKALHMGASSTFRLVSSASFVVHAHPLQDTMVAWQSPPCGHATLVLRPGIGACLWKGA